MDCNPPGSSVHGILQARIPDWIAISFSRRIFLTQGSVSLVSPELPGRLITTARSLHEVKAIITFILQMGRVKPREHKSFARSLVKSRAARLPQVPQTPNTVNLWHFTLHRGEVGPDGLLVTLERVTAGRMLTGPWLRQVCKMGGGCLMPTFRITEARGPRQHSAGDRAWVWSQTEYGFGLHIKFTNMKVLQQVT